MPTPCFFTLFLFVALLPSPIISIHLHSFRLLSWMSISNHISYSSHHIWVIYILTSFTFTTKTMNVYNFNFYHLNPFFFPSQMKSYSRCTWQIHNSFLLLGWYEFPSFISLLNSPLYHIINESREKRLDSMSIVFSFILHYQGFTLRLPLTKCSQSNSPPRAVTHL